MGLLHPSSVTAGDEYMDVRQLRQLSGGLKTETLVSASDQDGGGRHADLEDTTNTMTVYIEWIWDFVSISREMDDKWYWSVYQDTLSSFL